MKPVRLSDEQLSVVWSPERHDPEWKRDYLTRLREVCSSSGNGVGEWLCGQRALRSFPVRELRALESRLDSATLRNTLREVTLRARAFNPSLPIARVAIEYQRAPTQSTPIGTPQKISRPVERWSRRWRLQSDPTSSRSAPTPESA